MIILREWYFIGRKFGELKNFQFPSQLRFIVGFFIFWLVDKNLDENSFFISCLELKEDFLNCKKIRWKLVFHFSSWIERRTFCKRNVWWEYEYFLLWQKKGKNCCSIVVLLKVHKSDDECFQHRRARGQLVHPALGFSIHRWINVPASLKVSCDLSLFEFYAPTHSDCKRIQISSIYVTAIHKSDHNLKLETIVFNVVLLIYYNNIVLLYFIVIKFINLIENILD